MSLASGKIGGNAQKPYQICETNVWILCVDKNTKEAFLKKLKLCMQNFDYKDETKDVKGKVRNSCLTKLIIVVQTDRLQAINELQQLLQD